MNEKWQHCVACRWHEGVRFETFVLTYTFYDLSSRVDSIVLERDEALSPRL